MATNIEVKQFWNKPLTEYTSDPTTTIVGQQWLLKGAIPTLRTGITMLGFMGLLVHRQEAIFLKTKTSLGIKSILTQ